MLRRTFFAALAAAALGLVAAAPAQAQSTVKIGLLLPMTGPQQANGVQINAGMRLYMEQHGNTVASAPATLQSDKQVTHDDVVVDETNANAKTLKEIDFAHQKAALVFAQGGM